MCFFGTWKRVIQFCRCGPLFLINMFRKLWFSGTRPSGPQLVIHLLACKDGFNGKPRTKSMDTAVPRHRPRHKPQLHWSTGSADGIGWFAEDINDFLKESIDVLQEVIVFLWEFIDFLQEFTIFHIHISMFLWFSKEFHWFFSTICVSSMNSLILTSIFRFS